MLQERLRSAFASISMQGIQRTDQQFVSNREDSGHIALMCRHVCVLSSGILSRKYSPHLFQTTWMQFLFTLFGYTNLNVHWLSIIPWFIYSRLSLSRNRRDPQKKFEISVLRHIRFLVLRKKTIWTTNFYKCLCYLAVYWKYCGKGEKLLPRSNFSSFPQYFITWF